MGAAPASRGHHDRRAARQQHGCPSEVPPEAGRIDLYCQTLLDPDQGQSLLIFTATPGTESHDKLALQTVLGADTFAGS
ncbi:MmyB family transcriptional regulator [Streptomyces sp. NPDC001100]